LIKNPLLISRIKPTTKIKINNDVLIFTFNGVKKFNKTAVKANKKDPKKIDL
jgi:hypothetical protein